MKKHIKEWSKQPAAIRCDAEQRYILHLAGRLSDKLTGLRDGGSGAGSLTLDEVQTMLSIALRLADQVLRPEVTITVVS